MRYLTILWIAGLLVGCGGGGTATKVKQDGRIYVENVWTADSRTGACLVARLEKVDDQVIESELQEISYRIGTVEITSEFGAIPGGSKAIIHLKSLCGRTLDFHEEVMIDGSVVIQVTRVEYDSGQLIYEVRSFGR